MIESLRQRRPLRLRIFSADDALKTFVLCDVLFSFIVTTSLQCCSFAVHKALTSQAAA